MPTKVCSRKKLLIGMEEVLRQTEPHTKKEPAQLVSSPDPDSQQLRVDYITATWKVGLGNKNDALVPSVPQCLCSKMVRQSKFRTNLAPFSDIE